MFILAEQDGNTYGPTDLSESLEKLTEGLEYQDVVDGTYQIWQYPSGKVYSLATDRKLDKSANQYSTPYTSKGTVWLPRLDEIDIDTEKVSAAYEALSK